jgi:hypothetical protein
MTVDSGFDSISQPRREVSNFVEKVVRADGQLLSLSGRKSKLGEPLHISVRFGEDSVNADTQYLIIDVLASRENEYVPVGIYDWEIKEGRASGNKQRHGHLPAINEAQEAADRYWATGEGFHVRGDDFLKYASENGGFQMMNKLRREGIIKEEDQWTEPIYQRLGIGSLMIAISALVLNELEIEEMNLGTLSPLAEMPWRKFGGKDRVKLNPGDFSNHPEIRKTIEKFLIGYLIK